MAFHNDVGLSDVLSRIYALVMGVESDGYTALEISYSIGLAVGIIVFYNHIGGRRLTSDQPRLKWKCAIMSEMSIRQLWRWQTGKNWKRMWIR